MSNFGEFSDLIPAFLDEAREHLAIIEADLVQTENILQEERAVEPAFFQRMFRAAHAIRSGSELVGLLPLEELAIAIENLADFLRNGDVSPDAELIAAGLAAIDRLKAAAFDPDTPVDAADPIGTLRAIIDRRLSGRIRASADRTVNADTLFAGIPFSVSEYALERKLRKGNLFILSVDPAEHLEPLGRNIVEFSSALSSLGEILATANDDGKGSRVHLLYHTIMERDPLALSLPELPGELIRAVPRDALETLVKDKKGNDATKPERRRAAPRTASPSGTPPPARPAPAKKEPAAPEPPSCDETVKETTAWDTCTEFVSFFLDRELYAVPIFLVHDIKEMRPYSLLPNQPPFVFGVINLRGNIVPIFDLRRILGMPPKPFDRKTVILILNINGRMNGCVVDAISDVVTLEHQDKQSTPLLGRAMTADYVRFIGKDKKSGSLLIVLDIEKMLPE